MDIVLDELSLGSLGPALVLRILIRLVLAGLMGALLGYERTREHKEAGLRTHMLVALAAALYTVVHLEGSIRSADMSRVIQGIATGIGFLGAGTILKLSTEHQIKGLTTAASIWLTAAAGMAVGAGWLWPAFIGVILAWLILYCLHDCEHRISQRCPPKPPETGNHEP